MSRYRRVRKRRGGFLLLEVLISVILISVGLVYVVRSLSISSRAIETTARFLKSVTLLEERMWDLEAKGTIKKGTEEGAIEQDPEYSWRVEAEKAEDLPLNIVKLIIQWKDRAGKQGASIITYLWNEEE